MRRQLHVPTRVHLKHANFHRPALRNVADVGVRLIAQRGLRNIAKMDAVIVTGMNCNGFHKILIHQLLTAFRPGSGPLGT